MLGRYEDKYLRLIIFVFGFVLAVKKHKNAFSFAKEDSIN